jgi:hypothetical protein
LGSCLYLIWGSDRNLWGCRCAVATREKTTFLCPKTFALFTLRTLLNAIICCSQLNTQGVLGRFPASAFLVIDVVGLQSMYLVVMPKISLIVILVMYVRYLYSINCSTVICLPSMLYLSYGETALVNCGPQPNFLYIVTLFYFTRTVYFTWITIILLPLDTLIPLFTTNRWDWQPHRKLGAKYLFMLCAGFTLLLGEEAPTSTTHQQVVWCHCPECHEASKHHLLKFGSLILDWLPWFHNWGKTWCCAHHTFSWGSQLVGHLHHWYVSNVSIIFDAPCLFLHHLPIVSLHLVAFLYIFRN